MKKYWIWIVFLFLLFVISTLWDVKWWWVWSQESISWVWNYSEKIQDLKKVTNNLNIVVPEKIEKNRTDITKLLKRKQLVWWEYLEDLIKAIVINASYEVQWWNATSLLLTTNLPIFSKVNDVWERVIYISTDPDKLNWLIKPDKIDVFVNNINDMLWITNELTSKSWILSKYHSDWPVWYWIVSRSLNYSVNKFFEMLDTKEMLWSIIPVETKDSYIFVWLAALEKWLKNYSQNNSTSDQFQENNQFVVEWKTQIDWFLFNYCQKEFFSWNHANTLNMFKHKRFQECQLLENDFDHDWVNELILVNDKYKVSNIYYQDIEWDNKLIIWPIFKSDKQIIKLLENDKNYYSSFILKDWIDTNAYKNILQNNNAVSVKWWSTTEFRNVDLTQSFKWIQWKKNLYTVKELFSDQNNWYNNYKISWFYSVTPQNQYWRDHWEWWIIVQDKNNKTWWIFLNEKYIWFANRWFKDYWAYSPTEYILIPRKEAWVNLKNSFIEVEFWTKTWWRTLTLKIDWKEKLIVQEWWLDKIIFPEWVENKEIQLTWNTTTKLLDAFTDINKIWLLAYSDWESKAEKQNSIYDLKFLVPSMSNIFVYWIKNDKNSSWFQLNQILSLNWYEYNFISLNSASDKSAKNIVVKEWTSFDDEIKNVSWKPQYMLHNENIWWKSAYIWINLHLRSTKYFQKDSLYLEQNKNLYFNYDKKNELYILSDDSYEDINIKWIKFWDYDFLNWCSYEEIINNDLENCAKNLYSIDVDNDLWSEWLYNNTREIQIFNNIIKYNTSWTYSINFVPIFKDWWMSFCNTFKQKVPYYKDIWWWKCWWWGSWICETNYWLIFYDNVWIYKTFVLWWDNKDKKSYINADTSMWKDFICIS